MVVALGIFIEYLMKLVGFTAVKVVEAAKHCKTSASRTSTSTSATLKDEEQGEGNESREIIAENIRDEGDEKEDPIIKRARHYLPLAQNQRVGEWVMEQKKHVRIPGGLHIISLHTCGESDFKFKIAINIEHHVDRLGAFVTIVLGEMVANVFFKNNIAPGINKCVFVL